ETSFSAAVDVIKSAHVEAKGAKNGVGLVKCMGRHSGFIACHAALASTDVDFVLIPELPVSLEGETGLLRLLERRLVRDAQPVMLIGRWHGRFVHVPMPLATRFRKQVDTAGDLWTSVIESTGQPVAFNM